MSAAAAMAIAIISTRLSVTLVLDSMDLAAVLTTVGWHFIRLLRAECVPLMIVVINESAVINCRSQGTRAEAVFDKSMASFGTTFSHLSAALASAVFISLTGHALATVGCTIGTARSLVCLMRCLVNRHLFFTLLSGLLGSEAS